jgi:hypothetical protein
VTEPQQTGLDAHIGRLRRQQARDRRQQRLSALSARMVNMRRGWLLIRVEDGSPITVREARMLADAVVEQL